MPPGGSPASSPQLMHHRVGFFFQESFAPMRADGPFLMLRRLK